MLFLPFRYCFALVIHLVKYSIGKEHTKLNISNTDTYDKKKNDEKKLMSKRAGTILGDPGAVSRVGRKGATKGFKYGRKRAPGYRLSPNYFQKLKRMPAPDWAQKMLCIIVPNRRTVSPKFFS